MEGDTRTKTTTREGFRLVRFRQKVLIHHPSSIIHQSVKKGFVPKKASGVVRVLSISKSSDKSLSLGE
jgi:hypothetical protein